VWKLARMSFGRNRGGCQAFPGHMDGLWNQRTVLSCSYSSGIGFADYYPHLLKSTPEITLQCAHHLSRAVWCSRLGTHTPCTLPVLANHWCRNHANTPRYSAPSSTTVLCLRNQDESGTLILSRSIAHEISFTCIQEFRPLNLPNQKTNYCSSCSCAVFAHCCLVTLSLRMGRRQWGR